MDKFNVNGRIAIITGGNGQLGTQYAKTLLLSGAKVVIFDIAKEPNAELSNYLKTHPFKFFSVDITKKEQIEDVISKVVIDWGVPSILVNNAAVDSPPGANTDENQSFEKYSIQSWNTVMNVTLTGTFLCCQVIGSLMAKNGGGSVINICSTYGLVSPNQSIYKFCI